MARDCDVERRPVRSWVAIPVTALVLAALIGGCRSHASGAKAVPTTTTRAAAVSCGAGGSVGATVRHLYSRVGSVWIWVETSPRPPVRVGSLVKVVWRMTGTGSPRVALVTPAGRAGRMTFGPEFHAHSTFHHPGAEYGTGFRPMMAGCWQLTMRRGNVEGTLPVLVQ
jgi:hypothetical protein